MDDVSLCLASENDEYVDASLRVIVSMHARFTCVTLLDPPTRCELLPHRDSETSTQKD
jgi:hypothetical protein